MNIEDIKKKAKRISREFVLINAGIVLLGILLVVYPAQSKEIICRALGAVLSVWGVFKIIDYIKLRHNEIFGSFALVQGCALLGFGVYILIQPNVLAAFITAALSIILFIGAVLKLQYALEFSKYDSKGRWFQAAAAIVMIIASVISFVNPFGEASNILMMFIGISLIIDGVWDLLTIAYISKTFKEAKEEFKKAGKKARTKKSTEYIDAEAVDVDDNN